MLHKCVRRWHAHAHAHDQCSDKREGRGAHREVQDRARNAEDKRQGDANRRREVERMWRDAKEKSRQDAKRQQQKQSAEAAGEGGLIKAENGTVLKVINGVAHKRVGGGWIPYQEYEERKDKVRERRMSHDDADAQVLPKLTAGLSQPISRPHSSVSAHDDPESGARSRTSSSSSICRPVPPARGSQKVNQSAARPGSRGETTHAGRGKRDGSTPPSSNENSLPQCMLPPIPATRAAVGQTQIIASQASARGHR